jgi:hypothetical protein
VHARLGDELAQFEVGLQRHALRPAHGGRVFHRAVEQRRHAEQHDEVDQQRGHHLVDTPSLFFMQRRAEQQQRAGHGGGQHHQREQHPRRQLEARAAVHAAHGDGGQRAGVELALGADVEQPRLEGDRGGQAGEDQRVARVSVSLHANTEPKPPCSSSA